VASIIDVKDFDITEETLADIANFVGPHIDSGEPVRIKIAVEKFDEQRQNKMTARTTLLRLMDEKEVYYREYDYDFDFYREKYFWKRRLIHITQGEALFLFRLLVLRKFNDAQRYYIYNIRKRYGNNFLREVVRA
jgi:hypothetical protein